MSILCVCGRGLGSIGISDWGSPVQSVDPCDLTLPLANHRAGIAVGADWSGSIGDYLSLGHLHHEKSVTRGKE